MLRAWRTQHGPHVSSAAAPAGRLSLGEAGMTGSTARALREKFMAAPKQKKRRRPTTTLSVPFSRKMHSRVFAYTPECYNLWIELEFDAHVVAFNLEPEPLVVARGDTDYEFPLLGASVDVAGHLSLHILAKTFEKVASAVLGDQLLRAEELAGAHASIRLWSDLDDMRRQDRSTKDSLLRYVCAPQAAPDASIEKRILQILAEFRKPSVWDILQNLKQFDEEEIKAAIANLVIGRKVFIDMRRRFSHFSEISLQEVFDA